jgi:CelD/BcsL family acetyltransferase involved in cellulose biosynthesis
VISVEALRSFAELEPHLPFWREAARHRDADPDFFRAVAEGVPGFLRPMALRVAREGVTVALLLGRLERVRPAARLGRWRVPLPRLRQLTLVHGGLLGEGSEAAMAAAHAALRDLLTRREADAVSLHAAPSAHPLVRRLLAEPSAWRRDAAPVPAVLHLATMAEGNAVTDRLNRDGRAKHRNRERRLREVHGAGFRIEELRAPEEVPRLVALAEAVMGRNYQRGLGVGFRNDPAMRARLLRSAGQGWLRGFVLHLGERPAVFWIGDLREGCFHSDFLAYDQAQGAHSPGLWLTVAAMERLAAEGARRVDFGLGDAFWKARLADAREELVTVGLYAPRPRPLAAKLIREGCAAGQGAASAALARLGALEAVRRRLRGSGAPAQRAAR